MKECLHDVGNQNISTGTLYQTTLARNLITTYVTEHQSHYKIHQLIFDFCLERDLTIINVSGIEVMRFYVKLCIL